MNFIDAHKICCKYADIFATSSNYLKPISLLYSCGVSSKREIEDAMILRFSHSVLWNTFDPEEFKSMQALLVLLDTFVEDTFARNFTESLEISNKSALYKLLNRRQVDEAEQFILKNTKAQMHNTSRLDDAVVHTVHYKSNVFMPKMKLLRQDINIIDDVEYTQRFLTLISDFYGEVCRFSRITSTPSDSFLFVSTKIMKDLMDLDSYREYYKNYRSYILHELYD